MTLCGLCSVHSLADDWASLGGGGGGCGLSSSPARPANCFTTETVLAEYECFGRCDSDPECKAVTVDSSSFFPLCELWTCTPNQKSTEWPSASCRIKPSLSQSMAMPDGETVEMFASAAKDYILVTEKTCASVLS